MSNEGMIPGVLMRPEVVIDEYNIFGFRVHGPIEVIHISRFTHGALVLQFGRHGTDLR